MRAGAAQRRSTIASSAGSRSAASSSTPDGRRSPRGQRECPQPLPQPPLREGVGPAQRRVQQRDRRVLVEPGRVERAPQEQQQRRDGRLQVQRQVLGLGDGRHAGGVQGPLQRRELPGGRAHDDRHPGPRDAAQQVGLAQPVGDERRLGGLGRERARLHVAAGPLGLELTVPGRSPQPGRDPPDRRQQPRAEPPRHGQRHLDGVGEVQLEVLDDGRVGPAEGERRGVGVGERDEVLAVARDQLQQLDLGRVGVGELVDVDVLQPLPLPFEQHLIVREHPGRDPDQLRVVVGDGAPAGGVAQGEHLEVLAEERGRRRPVRPVVDLRQLRQPLRRDAPLDGAQQQVAQFGRERPGGQGAAQGLRPGDGRLGQQLPDHQVLLGAGQQARGALPPFDSGSPEQAEGVPVKGPDHRLGRRAQPARPAQPPLDPVAQPHRAAPAEREHEDLLRVGALGHPLRDRLDERARLAGAGPADDEQRPAGVLHDEPLPGVREDRGGRDGTAPHEPVGPTGGGGRGHATNRITRPRARPR
ncbi:hypothetical protein GCM10020218_023130 [Dactylosporangium vinaceum]